MNVLSDKFQLAPGQVHIWHTTVTTTPAQENVLLALLSPEETARAERFRFPVHRQRFIAARGYLRQLLSAYLKQPAESIIFSYSHRGKPYLPDQRLQFNVSHSHDMAVYAFTLDQPVGIDIEKVKADYDDGVAERFFSPQEYADLTALPEEQRALCFYRIWARKEAMIKVSGEGFAFALSSFTVPTDNVTTPFQVIFHAESGWTLQSFAVSSEYQAAFATPQTIKVLSIRDLHNDFTL